MVKKNGWTLVESMIVIAIIGLLAAVAVPSFIKSQKIIKIKKMGYTTQQATAILDYQNEHMGVSAKEAFQVVVSGPENEKAISAAFVPAVSLLETPSSKDECDLPNGTTDLIEVGKGWYTFRWDGHKYLIRTSFDSTISKLGVVCIERLD